MRIYKVKGRPDEDLISMAKSGKLVIINAEKVISSKLVESAYLKAKRSFEEGTNISRDMGTEVMLYLSGNRQVSEAIRNYGIGDSEIYYIIAEGEFNPADHGLLEIADNHNADERLMEELEKIAMFDIKK
ncbi:MAG: hypothetical protein C0180_00040 [Aciduliprofundum sp.]|nr:MAG: hypothetical protein C0180_00040 [Aciduliprofundum sp.]